jgi:HEAT repeat protein
MKAYSEEKLARMVEALLEDDPYGDCWDALEDLEDQPALHLVPAVTAALARAGSRPAYQRLVWLLSQHRTEGAFQALVQEAYRQEEWTGIAVAAISLSAHPDARVVLRNMLLREGAPYRRVAAAYALANRYPSDAIEPLVQVAASPADPIRKTAFRALNRMGQPHELVQRLLTLEGLELPRRIDLLQMLAGLLPWFDVVKYLLWLARTPAFGLQVQAVEALTLLEPRLVLLRATGGIEEPRLLRPTTGADNTVETALLRPAAPAEAG